MLIGPKIGGLSAGTPLLLAAGSHSSLPPAPALPPSAPSSDVRASVSRGRQLLWEEEVPEKVQRQLAGLTAGRILGAEDLDLATYLKDFFRIEAIDEAVFKRAVGVSPRTVLASWSRPGKKAQDTSTVERLYQLLLRHHLRFDEPIPDPIDLQWKVFDKILNPLMEHHDQGSVTTINVPLPQFLADLSYEDLTYENAIRLLSERTEIGYEEMSAYVRSVFAQGLTGQTLQNHAKHAVTLSHLPEKSRDTVQLLLGPSGPVLYGFFWLHEQIRHYATVLLPDGSAIHPMIGPLSRYRFRLVPKDINLAEIKGARHQFDYERFPYSYLRHDSDPFGNLLDELKARLVLQDLLQPGSTVHDQATLDGMYRRHLEMRQLFFDYSANPQAHHINTPQRLYDFYREILRLAHERRELTPLRGTLSFREQSIALSVPPISDPGCIVSPHILALLVRVAEQNGFADLKAFLYLHILWSAFRSQSLMMKEEFALLVQKLFPQLGSSDQQRLIAGYRDFQRIIEHDAMIGLLDGAHDAVQHLYRDLLTTSPDALLDRKSAARMEYPPLHPADIPVASGAQPDIVPATEQRIAATVKPAVRLESRVEQLVQAFISHRLGRTESAAPLAEGIRLVLPALLHGVCHRFAKQLQLGKRIKAEAIRTEVQLLVERRLQLLDRPPLTNGEIMTLCEMSATYLQELSALYTRLAAAIDRGSGATEFHATRTALARRLFEAEPQDGDALVREILTELGFYRTNLARIVTTVTAWFDEQGDQLKRELDNLTTFIELFSDMGPDDLTAGTFWPCFKSEALKLGLHLPNAAAADALCDDYRQRAAVFLADTTGVEQVHERISQLQNQWDKPCVIDTASPPQTTDAEQSKPTLIDPVNENERRPQWQFNPQKILLPSFAEHWEHIAASLSIALSWSQDPDAHCLLFYVDEQSQLSFDVISRDEAITMKKLSDQRRNNFALDRGREKIRFYQMMTWIPLNPHALARIASVARALVSQDPESAMEGLLVLSLALCRDVSDEPYIHELQQLERLAFGNDDDDLVPALNRFVKRHRHSIERRRRLFLNLGYHAQRPRAHFNALMNVASEDLWLAVAASHGLNHLEQSEIPTANRRALQGHFGGLEGSQRAIGQRVFALSVELARLWPEVGNRMATEWAALYAREPETLVVAQHCPELFFFSSPQIASAHIKHMENVEGLLNETPTINKRERVHNAWIRMGTAPSESINLLAQFSLNEAADKLDYILSNGLKAILNEKTMAPVVAAVTLMLLSRFSRYLKAWNFLIQEFTKLQRTRDKRAGAVRRRFRHAILQFYETNRDEILQRMWENIDRDGTAVKMEHILSRVDGPKFSLSRQFPELEDQVRYTDIDALYFECVIDHTVNASAHENGIQRSLYQIFTDEDLKDIYPLLTSLHRRGLWTATSIANGPTLREAVIKTYEAHRAPTD